MTLCGPGMTMSGASPYRAVHNSAYWSGAPYVGLGPAAHSFDGLRRSWNPADTEAYIRYWMRYPVGAGYDDVEADHPGAGYDDVETGQLDDGAPGFEVLTPEQQAMERVMLALRTADGLSEAELRRLCGDARVDALLRQTYLEKSRINANLRIPERHGFISDTIIAELV